MKKIAYILLFFLNSFQVKAQYEPFPDSNAFWRVTWGTSICPSQGSEYIYQITGDTLIGSNLYHKLDRYGQILSCAMPFTYSPLFTAGYSGSYRNDTLNKKVYFIPKDSISEELLYDFNLVTGDTIKGYLDSMAKMKFGTTFYAVIDSLDTILINGSYRKKWYYHSPNNSWNFIIEGIGSNIGLLETLLDQFDDFGELRCHTQNNITFYSVFGYTPCSLIVNINSFYDKKEINITPNPVLNFEPIIINISGIYNNISLEVCNLMGVKYYVSTKKYDNTIIVDISTLSDGIYIFYIKENNQVIKFKKIIVLK